MSNVRPGFTLIELLITIAIIGILSGIVFIAVKSVRENARIVSGKHFERSIFDVLEPTLTGRWDVTKGVATLPDLSGRGFNGTINGATVVEGIKGDALQFNGRSDHVSFQKPFFSTPPKKLTISLWAKSLSNLILENQVLFYHALHGEFMIGYSTAHQFFFAFKLANGEWKGVAARQTSDAGQWYHVTGVLNGEKDEALLYVDGVLQGSIRLGAALWNATGEPSIGARKRPSGVTNPFHGIIDEIKLYGDST